MQIRPHGIEMKRLLFVLPLRAIFPSILRDLTVTNNQIHLAFRAHEVLTVSLAP